MRIGNGAFNQRQHDIWGTMLDSVYLHASRGKDPENAVAGAQGAGRGGHQTLEEPDRGIWEVRGEPQHFTSSKVMCWVALDRGKLAELQGEKSHAEQWRVIAEEIKADILANGVDARGCSDPAVRQRRPGRPHCCWCRWCGSCPDDPGTGRCWRSPTNSPRTAGAALPRPRRPTTALSGEEGTFTICSFWLVSALVEIGEVSRARHPVERLLSFASPLHLYAEGDRAQHRPAPGELPQAFTHLALINAVVHVIRRGAGRRHLVFQPANAPA